MSKHGTPGSFFNIDVNDSSPPLSPTEDTPTILGCSQDEVTPTAQGHEADNRFKVALLVNIMREERGKYRLTRKTWEPQELAPTNILHIPLSAGGREFVEIKLTKVNDLAKNSPETTSADTQIRPGEHKKQELERGK